MDIQIFGDAVESLRLGPFDASAINCMSGSAFTSAAIPCTKQRMVIDSKNSDEFWNRGPNAFGLRDA